MGLVEPIGVVIPRGPRRYHVGLMALLACLPDSVRSRSLDSLILRQRSCASSSLGRTDWLGHSRLTRAAAVLI